MLRASVRAAVVESLHDLCGCAADAVSDADALVDDLGVDSFGAVNLVTSIEDRIGMLLPEGCEGELVGIRTVGELVDRLAALLAISAGDGGRDLG